MISLPEEIRAIMFDLGGVIMDLDVDLSKKALGRLGFHESMFHLRNTDNNVFIDLELGHINTDQFFNRLREILGTPVNDLLLERAWNDMVLGFRKEKILLLQHLRKDYGLFLLSNTNDIHIKYCNQILKDRYNIPGLETLFTKTFYSHQLGLRKPQQEIFSSVLKTAPYPPNQIFYIDDTAEHIQTALSMGFHCHLHQRNAPLLFKNL